MQPTPSMTDTDFIWTVLGFGLLAGAVVGSIYVFIWLPIRLILAIIHKLER